MVNQLTPDQFKKNLDTLKHRLHEAAERCGRSAQTVKLMAVTKSFPKEYMQIAHQGGITLFGENRVQEAVEKYRGLNLDLHLVGHLQRNKARKAAETFSCVQSIDKLETAKSLQQHCSNMDKKMDILLEVNTSGEESKFGFRNTEELISVLEQIMEMDTMRIRGLMTIGPFTGDTKRIQAAFAGLRSLFQELKKRYPELNLDTLSMGMSGDFEIAVEEGSTLIRIGTALFGAREGWST